MPGAVYNAKAPPSATPAMAITAVRNGSCSTKAVAPEDLLVEEEVGEVEVEVEVELEEGLVVLDEARKSGQRTKWMKSWRGRYILPHSCF